MCDIPDEVRRRLIEFHTWNSRIGGEREHEEGYSYDPVTKTFYQTDWADWTTRYGFVSGHNFIKKIDATLDLYDMLVRHLLKNGGAA